jgi:hypothetical protein
MVEATASAATGSRSVARQESPCFFMAGAPGGWTVDPDGAAPEVGGSASAATRGPGNALCGAGLGARVADGRRRRNRPRCHGRMGFGLWLAARARKPLKLGGWKPRLPTAGARSLACGARAVFAQSLMRPERNAPKPRRETCEPEETDLLWPTPSRFGNDADPSFDGAPAPPE